MELESITGNVQHKNSNRNTSGHRTRSQNRTEAERCRWFVAITLCLGLICFLLFGILVLYIRLTAERDLMKMSYMNIVEDYNETLNSLKINYSQLTNKREELQIRFSSMNQNKLELETQVKNIAKSGTVWYYVSRGKKSWSESRQFCRNRGGDLVIINTEDKQRYISSIAKENVWIGLSDLQNEGNMKWVDNTTLNKGFWDENEPNNHFGKEDCVELNPTKPVLNNWNDLLCSNTNRWICEKKVL